jgi:hypothetical protein
MSEPERDTSSQAAIRLTITPVSDFYDKDDPRSESEAFELRRALTRELPEQIEDRADPTGKGVLSELVVNLVGGGAIRALVDGFKAWLDARPTHRTVNVEFEFEENGVIRKGKFTADATNVDSVSLAALARGVVESAG